MTDQQHDPRRAHLDRRRRQTWRILAVGMVLATLAAAATGLAGLPGQVGAVGFLLVTALACVLTAVVALVTSMLDDLADRGVGRHRPVLAGCLLLLGFVLIGMVMQVAGA
jgi:hypothetical protein